MVAALAAAGAILLSACAGLPADEAKSSSIALTDTSTTRLGAALVPLITVQPGKTGLIALPDGHSGFAARMLLARAAERSIDVQTYVWNGDATGTLLFEQMRRAAQRGVRVRLLLDDQNTVGLDPLLALIAAEPNLELRLFNPFVSRDYRKLGFATDFARLNRRMHNKSFTVDNQVSVVGGRNIGDEYFSAHRTGNFVDSEVITVGAMPHEVSVLFDRYWNSASAYSATAILKGVVPMTEQAFASRVVEFRASDMAAPYQAAVERSALVTRLLSGTLPIEWADARLIFDDPEKVLHLPGTRELQMLPRLLDAMGRPTRELDLVSPYFVPDEKALNALTDLARRGVRVRVLTNSLGATDVVPVHAAYAKSRVALLRSGVRLYELRSAGRSTDSNQDGKPGGSRSSLHAKNFSIDRERAFAGSFNLDPRSENLNTEMGLVMSSPRLASALSKALDELLPTIAFEVTLSANGQLQWLSANQPPEVVEPDTTAWRRFVDRVLGWVPFFDWLL